MDDLDVNAAMDGITKAGDMEREQTARENFNAFSSGLKTPEPSSNPQEVAAATRHPDTGGALRIDHWVQHLPRNVSVGLLDAAVNTGDAIRDFYHSKAANFFGQPEIPTPAEGTAPPPAPLKPTKDELAQHVTGDAIYNHVRGSVMTFRNRLASGFENPEDALTQQVSQLAIPGLGLAKLAGATASLGLANTARVALADAVVAGTVLEPHSGRLADLAELGKHTEGKLGAVFNTLAPDGSLMNHYLNWMTDRTGEGDFEGRVKNMIDSLSGSAALSGVINTALGSVRYAKYIAENAGTGPVPGSLQAQLGHLAFHGTPHTFDTFDAAKIGSGEGNQTYGHGLYFAESKTTATHYQQKLTGSQNQAFIAAKSEVSSASGDKAKALTVLNDKAANQNTPVMRDFYKRAADYVKSGATDRGTGMLAHVEIPDEIVGKMLNHDATLEMQPEVLAKIPKEDLDRITQMQYDQQGEQTDLTHLTGAEFRQTIEQAIDHGYLNPPGTGNKGVEAAASAYLDSHDIPGIKYLDAGSRKAATPKGFFGSPSHGTGDGTRNLVLFDPQHAKIIKKE